MAAPDETIIFLHLPKAGGMTLHRILEERYPPERVYTFEGKKPLVAVERFRLLPEAQRARYRVLKGHVVYGLHDSTSTPCTYITLLRDPVERVISQYYYAKSRPEHYLYERLNKEGMTLFEYASLRLTPEIVNQQTGMLAGQAIGAKGVEVTSASLSLAKKHLQTHFRVVGLTEEFDTSLLLLQRAFGWSMPFYLRENVTSDKPNGAQIDPRARELLAELNCLDIELYAFARELLREECRAYGAGLRADLARFRRWNARYQQIMGPVTNWRRRIRAQRIRI